MSFNYLKMLSVITCWLFLSSLSFMRRSMICLMLFAVTDNIFIQKPTSLLLRSLYLLFCCAVALLLYCLCNIYIYIFIDLIPFSIYCGLQCWLVSLLQYKSKNININMNMNPEICLQFIF